ncbi:hypothetical protein [Agromyces italicus]|uniref:hypothetical protein n=1 Tax=Agromyces italicus TaxID=279572 RepID=UPI0012FCB74F|nr:hypothetical protein [Agromyces italicus]
MFRFIQHAAARSTKGKLVVIGLVAGAIVGLTATPATAAELSPTASPEPEFTLDSIDTAVAASGHLRAPAPSGLEAALTTAVSTKGTEAFVDRSLAFAENPSSHALSAVGKGFVDLSWAAIPGNDGYVVFRDGEQLTTTDTTSFRDLGASGSAHEYRISTSAPKSQSDWRPDEIEAVNAGSEAPRTGYNWVLFTQALDPGRKITDVAASTLAQTLATGASRILWSTFIASQYVDAPPVGCEYGSGYRFKGDNRSWIVPGQFTPGPYRVYTKAYVWWSHGPGSQMVGTDAGISATHVVNSAGTTVASRTATDWSAQTLQMSTENQVSMDIRTNFQARNPFCITGAIAGNYNATLTRAGSYAIGGEHRGAPNHEIYVYAETGLGSGPISTPSTAYRRAVVDFNCLIGAACPLQTIIAQGSY